MEISESSVLRDEKRSLEILQGLAVLGVTISIDNFGTGVSSLLYLQRFPARELKISRAFVSQLGKGINDQAVVASLVSLGRTLGLRIVAEGVETSGQQALLTAAGCDELQGFRLGKPMAGADLAVSEPESVLASASWSSRPLGLAPDSLGSGLGPF